MVLFLKRTARQKSEHLNFVTGLASGLVGGSILLYARRNAKQRIQDQEFLASQEIQPTTPATKQVPTIYVHGFRGGDYTTNKMVLSAQEATNADTYLKVIVDWKGRLSFEGTWSSGPNPLIQLVFSDKWMPTAQIVNWLDIALPKLKALFGFTEYNAVGHSLGATAWVMAEMRNYGISDFPKLNKLVLVAGPFDGVVAFGDWPNVNRFNRRGRPIIMNPRYLQMLLKRKKFPSNVSVLNIYGNVGDASNTDKYISVISAKSVRYLLEPIVKTFKEVEIWGQNAEHSKMHDNDNVLAMINHFLFGSLI